MEEQTNETYLDFTSPVDFDNVDWGFEKASQDLTNFMKALA